MAKKFDTIQYDIKDNIAFITLNRPHVRNAFNDKMIDDLINGFAEVANIDSVRLVIFSGQGDVFCAGADMNWMKRVVDYDYETNLKESLQLWKMLRNIYEFPKPIIGRINGSAFGGGTGLVSLCDVAIATNNSLFSFSEVKIGLIPSCISPFIIKKVGEARTREYFITGERLSAGKAERCGLINYVVEKSELDSKIHEMTYRILESGPHAVSNCKELIRNVTSMDLDEAGPYTSKLIAKMRTSDEGQEGMNSFLEKRKPSWVTKK